MFQRTDASTENVDVDAYETLKLILNLTVTLFYRLYTISTCMHAVYGGRRKMKYCENE